MELTEIYGQVFLACFQAVVYKIHEMTKRVEEWMPWLGQATEELISENGFGLNEEARRDALTWWDSILKDLLEGLQQRDEVLLEDVVEFGLKEFLECFFPEEELNRIRKEAVNGTDTV